METVLVVDDWPTVVTSIRRTLRRRFAVLAAGSAEEALRSELQGVGAAILDVRMPDMDGLQLARELRRRGFTGPLIFVTTNPDPDLAQELSALMPSALLGKPWEPGALEGALERLLDPDATQRAAR